MTFLKTMKTFVVGVAVIGATAFSQITAQEQVEVSDAELDKIAAAFQDIQKVNMEAQQQVIATVKESGFDPNRFNEMYQASASAEQTVEASDEEKQRFGEVMGKIQQMQTGFMKQIQEIISKEGLTMERYEKIAMALQTDADLQGRLRAAMEQKP